MNYYQFPDTTVLCNFAAVHHLDWLDDFLGARGRWTQAVFSETIKSSAYLPDLAALLDGNLLGEPVEVDDYDSVDLIRRVNFAASSLSTPTAHLGESETYYVLQNYEEFATSAWITDDVSAYDLAVKDGIDVMDTRDSLTELVRRSLVSPSEAFMAMMRMREMGRYPRNMPTSVNDFTP